jgi:alpha-L-fucosidase
MDLGGSLSIGLVDLREDIEHGQLVARYSVEGNDGGEWRAITQGTTIGCRKLDRCVPTNVRRIRIRIDEAVDTPRPVRIGLYAGG